MTDDVDSTVEYNSTGAQYIRNHPHVNFHNIFGGPKAQASIFKEACHNFRLEKVFRAPLA